MSKSSLCYLKINDNQG